MSTVEHKCRLSEEAVEHCQKKPVFYEGDAASSSTLDPGGQDAHFHCGDHDLTSSKLYCMIATYSLGQDPHDVCLSNKLRFFFAMKKLAQID